MLSQLKRFFRDEFGTTAVEYAVISSTIIIAIAVAVKLLGFDTNSIFDYILNQAATLLR